MLIEIDRIRSQTLQRRVRNYPDPLRAAVQTLARLAVFETEFHCDDDIFAERLNRFAHEFFLCERAVSRRRIEVPERSRALLDGLP